ncbi:MAG TPA: hypothetical protein VIN36_09145 [Thiobacillus sp.]
MFVYASNADNAAEVRQTLEALLPRVLHMMAAEGNSPDSRYAKAYDHVQAAAELLDEDSAPGG